MINDLETAFAKIIAHTGRTPFFEGQGAFDAASVSTYHGDLLAVSALFLPHAIKRVLERPAASVFLPKDAFEICVTETDICGLYALDYGKMTAFTKFTLGLALSDLVDHVAGQSADGILDLEILTKPMAPHWMLRLAEAVKHESTGDSLYSGALYSGPSNG